MLSNAHHRVFRKQCVRRLAEMAAASRIALIVVVPSLCELGASARAAEAPPIANPSFANCMEEEWSADPEVTGQSFDGKLSALCYLRPASIRRDSGRNPSGLLSLQKYLRDLTRAADQVYAGPTNEIFAQLPGVRFDIANRTGTAQGSFNIRSIVHIASDGNQRLDYASFSENVAAYGAQPALLQKVDIAFEVTAPMSSGYYGFRVESAVILMRPPNMTPNDFEGQAEYSFRAAFRSQVAQLIGDLETQL